MYMHSYINIVLRSDRYFFITAVHCDRPTFKIENGSYNECESCPYNTRLEVNCMDGYTVANVQLPRCDENGQWINTNAICQREYQLVIFQMTKERFFEGKIVKKSIPNGLNCFFIAVGYIKKSCSRMINTAG